MKKIKLFFTLSLISLALFLSSCNQPEDLTESEDNINLAYSIIFKTSECGNHPSYPLFIASGEAKPAKRDMQACALTIIQQKCPFVHYPYYCLRIFKNYKYENPFKNLQGDK